MCVFEFGQLFNVTELQPGRFKYVSPFGTPPLRLLTGDTVLDVTMEYDYEELKNECWLD